MTNTPWKCPQCGYDNAASAALCNLCGEMRPRAEPPPPVVAPPAAPPVAPEPTGLQPPSLESPAEQWSSPSKPPQAFDGSQTAWSNPSAGQWTKPPPGAWPQGPPPQAPRGPGCEVLVEFVALLPLSLFVYTLPGGLRNPNARTLLRILLAVMFIIGILAIPTMVSLAQHILAGAQGSLGE
ncbi:MAG TPA: hypothetical protein VGM37_21570 [Armatimonadota bacterium]